MKDQAKLFKEPRAKQGGLFAPIDTPAAKCEFWGVTLLSEIPVKGLGTQDWKGYEPAGWPGRNRPSLGRWIHKHYGAPVIADPMIGVGGLHMKAEDTSKVLVGCELVAKGVPVARANLGIGWNTFRVEQGDARSWSPRLTGAIAAIFSPPFGDANHSLGDSPMQNKIREDKGITSIEGFEEQPGQIGAMKYAEHLDAMTAVYAQVRTYAVTMVLVLRSWIRKGGEVDYIGDTIRAVRRTGWHIDGLHWRSIPPTMPMQWKVSKDPETPYTDTEWVLVARASGGAK